MSFGSRLKLFLNMIYRGEQNKSIANILQIDSSTLSRYTSDTTLPSADLLSRLTNLGVSINWLLNSEGAIFSNDTYGEIAKVRFLSNINNLQNSILENYTFSNQKIREALINEYETVSNFIQYIKQFNKPINEEAISLFFEKKSEISTELEDLLRQIYFYFFLQYNQKDKADFKVLFENLHKYETTVINLEQKHCELLQKIKELIDNHFGK